jgi:hypothetical protein
VNLQVLFLSDTQVDNEGLQHLSKMRKLRGLDLYDTKVGDKGLKHLSILTNLTTVALAGPARIMVKMRKMG